MKSFRNHVIILFIFLIFALVGYSQTIQVCPDCTVSSLKQAIDFSKPFDTIVLKKGTYREGNIIVDKPLTIIGKDSSIIDGEEKIEPITVVSDEVTLDGLHIRNVGVSYTEDLAAVRIKNSKNFTLQNLLIESPFFGIYIEKSSDGKVYNNKIIGEAEEEYNSGNGIQLWHSNNIIIENNLVKNLRDGIYLEFAHHCIIKDNLSFDNLRYGLHFMFSNDDVYQRNTFENNGAGVAVMFSKRIRMVENTFKNNWGTASYGLLLKEINDSKILSNTFYKNTIAINVEGSNRVTYEHNNFSNNGWGIKVRGACYANKFLKNNFLYNSFDVSYGGNINDNRFEGNYWSNYTGYDLDKNNVGDVPYRPVKLFSYIVDRTPESIVLLRSLFMDVIDFSERVSPVFTPKNLVDTTPSMKRIP